MSHMSVYKRLIQFNKTHFEFKKISFVQGKKEREERALAAFSVDLVNEKQTSKQTKLYTGGEDTVIAVFRLLANH